MRDNDYIVCVTAEDNDSIVCMTAEDRSCNFEPNDQSLSVHQELSVTWNVMRSYYSDYDINKIRPIRDRKEFYKSNGVQFSSPHSLREIVFSMTMDHTSAEKIPFPFDRRRLRWKESGSKVRLTTSLGSVINMVDEICSVIKGMAALGRKKLDILVAFDKQTKLSHQQYEAMARHHQELERAVIESLEEELGFRSKEALEKLMIDEKVLEMGMCVVRSEEMLRGCEVTSMPCSHGFIDYVVKWLMTRHTCPLCRFELPTDDISKNVL